MSAKLNELIRLSGWAVALTGMGAVLGRVNDDLIGEVLDKNVSSSGVKVAAEVATGVVLVRETSLLVIPSTAQAPLSDTVLWIAFFLASRRLRQNLERSLQAVDSWLPSGKKAAPQPTATGSTLSKMGIPPAVQQQMKQAVAASAAVAEAEDIAQFAGRVPNLANYDVSYEMGE